MSPEEPDYATAPFWPPAIKTWWWVLDDVQHRVGSHLPALLFRPWYWAWRPFCSWVDRRVGGPG